MIKPDHEVFNPALFQAMLMVPGIRGGSDTDTEYVDPGVDSVFSPSVTATCRAGVMNIEVETNNNFLGAVHARDYRRPACTNYGQGTSSTSLKINLLADQNTDQYCGVFVNKVTGDYVSSFNKLKQKQFIDFLLFMSLSDF